MYEYLNDTDFLVALDKQRLKEQYAKIVLLSFDEKPIREIQGQVTSGNLNVNGSSAIRRTISLTMLANQYNSNIENLDNEISLNKKVKVFVGYRNTLKSYSHYGDIIWFPCGMFILSSANVSRSISGWTISISGKDKMCLLDGSAGGTLPASTTFSEKWIMEDNGDYTIEYPTIYQIIFEAVNHWGGELAENIIISDLEDKVKLLVRYMGNNPIYFSDNYDSLSFSPDPTHSHICTYGEDAGYQETDFTYPGELILSAGETVVGLLDKIVNLLGNYEYFYTVDGKFVFQQIKNYLNTGSPLNELREEDYTKSYNNAKFLYSLTDLDTTTGITRSPKYDNLKNDFYVWGKRETATGAEVEIRYHLAIDTKPILDLARQYMWELRDEKTNLIVRYEFTYEPTYSGETSYKVTQVSVPCDEWREELYRLALVAQVSNSVYDNYYDSELIAEWRNLYDPMREEWNGTNHWNPDVTQNPKKLNFWLDFIDTGSELGGYSVKQIGRRTKVINSNEIKAIYNPEVPDIIFIEGLDNEAIRHYQNIGQKYFLLTEDYYDLFSASSTGVSCFDKIRELMYQNLNYNTTITLTCLPKYYMEPNNIIRVEDKESGINGNYQITQFSLPLTYNGTMSITATQVLTRI